MKIKPIRVLIIVSIFISVISIASGIYIYNDTKRREEEALTISKARESLIKDCNIIKKNKYYNGGIHNDRL